jgi:transcriptional regulator with XRE-family HTH domain
VDVSFNDEAFFGAMERRRQAENLSWRQLAKRLNLSASTFSRLARGRRPDVDTFLRLIAWLEMPADRFMTDGRSSGTPRESDTLDVIADVLRSDRTLPADGAGALEQLMRIAYANLRGIRDSSLVGARASKTRSRKKRLG